MERTLSFQQFYPAFLSFCFYGFVVQFPNKFGKNPVFALAGKNVFRDLSGLAFDWISHVDGVAILFCVKNSIMGRCCVSTWDLYCKLFDLPCTVFKLLFEANTVSFRNGFVI